MTKRTEMAYSTWAPKYRAAKERAERVSAMIVERMREVAKRSGLDPQYPAHHAHNAIVSADGGMRWSGVDYAGARLILRLQKLSWEPGRLVDSWSSKIRVVSDADARKAACPKLTSMVILGAA